MFHFNLAKDFKTVSELRETISSSLEQLKNSKQPLVVTQQGKPAAVMLDISSYNKLTEDYEVIAGILQGLRDSGAGRLHTSESLKESLIKDGKMDR